MEVYKFGGASVKDADGIRNMANILQQEKYDQVVIVISAMGKNTNKLEQILNSYLKEAQNLHLLNELKLEHQNICKALKIDDASFKKEINNLHSDLEAALNNYAGETYDLFYDQIVSFGELVSTKIFSAFLNQEGIVNNWLDAREIIQTDSHFREARVDWELTERKLKQALSISNAKINIIQGFIGREPAGLTTTLGREGSDFTASICAYCLDANQVTVWKDVEGILTADPRKFEDVQKLPLISFKEAIEMTYYGAKVIHPKTIKPLQNKSIPLKVRCFLNPTIDGTLITDQNQTGQIEYQPIFVHMANQILISVATKDFSFMEERNIGEVFQLLAKHRVRANMMQNGARSFSICADHVPKRIENLINSLKEIFKVTHNSDLELFTIRHYNSALLEQFFKTRTIYLEQRTRKTVQVVCK